MDEQATPPVWLVKQAPSGATVVTGWWWYWMGGGEWTTNPAQAKLFPSQRLAAAAAQEAGLQRCVIDASYDPEFWSHRRRLGRNLVE